MFFFKSDPELDALKVNGEAPPWMSPEGFRTLTGTTSSAGYLLPGETPRSMYERLARAAAHQLKRPDLKDKFFNMFWRSWLGASSPVLSNFGADRGLAISCLTADSVINTPLGGKLVSEIQTGDLVLTHKGRWRPVTEVQTRMSTDDIYELAVFGRTTKTKITGNHPVLTNEGWVKVDELNLNRHLVATNLTADYPEVDYTIDISEHCPYEWVEIDGRVCKKLADQEESASENYAKVNRHVPIDAELAWCLGLWFADGSQSIDKYKKPNGIRITLGIDDVEIAERWLDCMKSKFNVGGNYYLTKRTPDSLGRLGSWTSVNLNSLAIGHWFAAKFGVGCKVKSLPEFLLNLPKPIAKAFLEGFMLGDGSIKKGGICVTSLANLELCLGLYNLTLKLGLKSTLNLHTKPGALATVKHVRTLTISNWTEGGPGEVGGRSGIIFDGLMYRRIKTITKLTHNETVWDLTVAEDHSFSVAGVVVHNCFGSYTEDSMNGIINHVTEQSRLTWRGGGVASHLSDMRAIGAPIKSGGTSDGILAPLRMLNHTVPTISQNTMRRGSLAAYLNIDHPDIQTFLRMRQPEVDEEQRFMKTHHGVGITDEFVDKLKAGDEAAQELWAQILTLRMETGEPYLIFNTAANRDNPPAYARLGLKVNGSNLCCLEIDTEVVTKEGNFKIGEILNQLVEIWDGNSWASTTFEEMGQTSTIVEVLFADGSSMKVSPGHRFPLVNGSMVPAWSLVQSKDVILVETDKRYTGQEVRGEVVSATISNLESPQSMYCCTVSTTGMFALADGRMTGNSEIFLATSPEYTFVCCLSSLNVATYDEWDDDVVELAVYFLDAVMSEFLERARELAGLENAVRFAEKSRALGLGVLGYHTYLQSKGWAFDDPETFKFNSEFFKSLRAKAEVASVKLGQEYGIPDWCLELNRRNTHLLACAPTLTNSTICAVSRAIEPIEVNAGFNDGAKGTFTYANTQLIPVLEKHGQNNDLIWRSIAAKGGSVQHLNFLSDRDRLVFRTARELDQRVLVKQAADRGEYIDQGQSLNLFYEPDANPQDVHEAHWLAYTLGLKSLYYCKTGNKLKAQAIVEYGDNTSSNSLPYKLQQPDNNEECTVCQ